MLELTELSRRLENLIRVGVIDEVDYTIPAARVRYAEDVEGNPVLTAWLPWTARRAGNDIDWWAPEVGEQVVIISPSGDLALGVIMSSLYQTAYSAPESDENKRRTNFQDGSWLEYDRTAHKFTLTVNGGDVVVNATGNIDAAVGGDANITAGGDVTLDGASIAMNGGASGGVVCKNHACAFTGSPHPQGSTTISGGD